jgi:triosephosphate isomerase
MTSTSRRPIVGGNWKMNTVRDTAVDLAEDLVRRIGEEGRADVVLFPPFTNLDAVNTVIAGSALVLGAQDVCWAEAGAFTGEVSAAMLTAVGCTWVLVGHSERRHILGESDEVVNRKLHAALHGGLNVTLAVGETREERHGGHTEKVLDTQLTRSLASVRAEQMERLVIAYEPVWAIGTGETASPDQARDVHAFVRSVLARLYGEEIARATRIQYGGSVTAANAVELMDEPGIDGALVGGASLKPADFVTIVEAVARSVE